MTNNQTKQTIVIVDYGLGNIASILNMVRKVGGKARISNDQEEILGASKLILPGVGAFDHGIDLLHKKELFQPIQHKASQGTPILGICLGMQLLANKSEEGYSSGLALINARFKRFHFKNEHQGLRVPHVGWNHVEVMKKNPLIPFDGSEQRFYFTHSYYAECANPEDILATTEYGFTFTSAYSSDNIYGVQFHPEKSHRFGMALFRNYLEL